MRRQAPQTGNLSDGASPLSGAFGCRTWRHETGTPRRTGLISVSEGSNRLGTGRSVNRHGLFEPIDGISPQRLSSSRQDVNERLRHQQGLAQNLVELSDAARQVDVRADHREVESVARAHVAIRRLAMVQGNAHGDGAGKLACAVRSLHPGKAGRWAAYPGNVGLMAIVPCWCRWRRLRPLSMALKHQPRQGRET